MRYYTGTGCIAQPPYVVNFSKKTDNNILSLSTIDEYRYFDEQRGLVIEVIVDWALKNEILEKIENELQFKVGNTNYNGVIKELNDNNIIEAVFTNYIDAVIDGIYHTHVIDDNAKLVFSTTLLDYLLMTLHTRLLVMFNPIILNTIVFNLYASLEPFNHLPNSDSEAQSAYSNYQDIHREKHTFWIILLLKSLINPMRSS